jgi:putative transposase
MRNNLREITLTLKISIKKKSVINKLERASLVFQHFKNLIYLCVLEYYNNTKDIIPFTNQNFLEKFVKGKETLPFENEKIKNWKTQLIELWKNDIGSDTIKALVRQISKEYKSVLGKWANNQKASLPKPKKLKNTHKFTLTTNKNMISDKRFMKRNPSNAIVVRIGKSFGAIKIKLPKGMNNIKIRDVKLTWIRDIEVIVRISYEIYTNSEQFNLNKNNWLSIDIGVVNLVSCVSNVENLRSFIISGNPLKSLNQWIHKKVAELQSQQKYNQVRVLWRYRNKRIKSFFHRVSNIIIQTCLEHNIGTIILPKGLEREYQQKSDKSKKFNQEFRSIPLGKLLEIIKYKAKIFNIEVLEEPETYTSKVSSISSNIEILKGKSINDINQEDLKKLKFEGKRIKRGLFKDLKLNKVFNADLNGALNLAIKKLGNRIRKNFLSLKNWLDKLSRPIKVSSELELYNVPIRGSFSYTPIMECSDGHQGSLFVSI